MSEDTVLENVHADKSENENKQQQDNWQVKISTNQADAADERER